MELLNNRYRIIKHLYQNNLYNSYLINDLWEDNHIMQLNILNLDNIHKSIIDFYSDEFIKLINYNNENIVQIYNFNVISHIDNKKANREQYFYTCEYIENPLNILDYTKNFDLNDLMNLFIKLCNIINYLNLRGHIYEALNINNIYIIKKDNEYQIKIKDIATKILEKNAFINENPDDKYFMSPKYLSGEAPSFKHDLYSLAVVLLTLLSRNCNFKTNPKDNLNMFIEDLNNHKINRFNEEEINTINKLYPLLKKIIYLEDDDAFRNLTRFRITLNEQLGTDYTYKHQNEYSKINFHLKIIGRDKEVNKILHNYDNMLKYNPFTRVYLVQGEMGTGKTRFLEEIKFRFELKKANLYYSFSLSSLNESSDKMWVDILRKLILETDTEIIEKYEAELAKFFPDIVDRNNLNKERIEEHQTKYRLLNRIASFISESVKNKPTVFIIDNLDLANEFTLDTFSYLYSKVICNEKVIFIFSYNENSIFNNPMFARFISTIRYKKDWELVPITNLNHTQSGELIKSILDIFYTPVKLTEKIYSQSYGNPLFISEVIKDLYNHKILFVDNNTGIWHLDLPEDDLDYKLLIIPNTIEQAVLNQLKDIDEISHDILKTMSIFPNPISVDDIAYFIDKDLKEINYYIQELIKKGIISKLVGISENLYTINNKVLKDIIYDRIEPEERVNKHYLVTQMLEQKAEINIDDLIYHYERANNKEKLIEYCLKNAQIMHDSRNYHEEVNNLKKALVYIDKDFDITEVNIRIGIIYYNISQDNLAINYFLEAEKYALKTNNIKHLIDINSNLAKIYIGLNDITEGEKRLITTRSLLDQYDYFEAELEYKFTLAFKLRQEKQFDKSISYLDEIIAQADDYPLIKANCFRTKALIYQIGDKISEALELYEEAIKLFENTGNIRGSLSCLNNTGAIYSDIYQNTEKALKYYLKVKDFSEEYNIELYGLIALINIACIHELRNNNKLAYDYFKQSLEIALQGNYNNEVFFIYNMLTKTCIRLNKYSEAYQYHNLILQEIEKSSYQSLDIYEFYKASADLYYAFGDFVKAQEFIKKTTEFYESGVSYEQFLYTIQLSIINLRLKDEYETDIQDIIKTSQKFISPDLKVLTLSNAAIALGERKDYKNARLLLKEIKESLTNKLHEEILAKYYVALGINDLENKTSDYLQEALNLAKNLGNKVLVAQISTLIGDYYYSIDNYYQAVSFYIEAWELLKELINDVPKEFKLTFINSYKYARIFYRIKYICYIIIDNNTISNTDIEETFNKYDVKSLEELNSILNIDLTKQFMNNKDFMEFVCQQYIANLPNQKSDITEVISQLSNNTVSNIELLLNYLAAATLATNGFLALENNKNDFNIISALNDKYKIPNNRYLFEKAKQSLEPICVSKNMTTNNIDGNIFSDDVKAYLCIPITSNLFQNNSDTSIIEDANSIIGYLYLESDRVINNFNEAGLKKCLDVINFLALLIEKHQLIIDASIDKLTGALTRKYLENTIKRAIINANINKSVFSIIMYDLDNFKNINDRFGHQTGDEVLASISRIVLNNIDKTASIGRYGGEEFIIILPGVDSREAYSIAEDLRIKISKEGILSDKAEVTVSMGIATYPKHGQTMDELFEKVDQALYHGKETGKNRCFIWNEKFSHSKTKTKDKLTGIISGNTVQDARNMLAIVELIQLTNKNIAKESKIYQFLGRAIEIIDAQYGYLLLIDNNQIIHKYARQAQKEEWLKNININQKIINSVLESKQGVYLIDWDDIGKQDLITGLPEWDSILIIPVFVKDEIKAILYFTVSTREKEFSINEYNFINILSDLIPPILP